MSPGLTPEGVQGQQSKMEAKQAEEMVRLSEEHRRVAAHLDDLQSTLLGAQLHETQRFGQVSFYSAWPHDVSHVACGGACSWGPSCTRLSALARSALTQLCVSCCMPESTLLGAQLHETQRFGRVSLGILSLCAS